MHSRIDIDFDITALAIAISLATTRFDINRNRSSVPRSNDEIRTSKILVDGTELYAASVIAEQARYCYLGTHAVNHSARCEVFVAHSSTQPLCHVFLVDMLSIFK